MTDTVQIWTIILVLGIGSFLIRFSFLGLVGDRPLPAWLLRHLRYTAVAILPALVTPLVVWPSATGGELDPSRLMAAFAAFAAAYWMKNAIWGMCVGGVTLWALLWLVP